MDERVSFILEWQADQSSFAELCRAFGISRTLGYRYVDRFLDYGLEGLRGRSSSPGAAWNRTDAELERAVVALRKETKGYGALKIHEMLQERYPNRPLPAVSTIELILKRNGLVKKRRAVRRIREVHPIFNAQQPNEIWSADFKGEFRMGNMRYCYPLTVMDSYSRYVLAVQGMHNPTYEGTRAVFEALFEEHGLPQQIHTDNGQPFASAVSLSRLTRLAVWFIDLGIVPVYSDPGHPEQNGSHERMHRELKADTARPPGHSLGRQQRKFDEFRQRYNELRPHQALQQKRPAQLYCRSPRPYRQEPRTWAYPPEMTVHYVCRNGAIRWHRDTWVSVSTTLIEKYVALEQIAEEQWRVYYRDVLLGYLDGPSRRIRDDQGRLHRTEKCKQSA